jgi:hypothetical protein
MPWFTVESRWTDQTQQGDGIDDDLRRSANTRSGKAPAGFEKGTIEPGELIADPDARAYYSRMWKSAQGDSPGAAHEEGVTYERRSGSRMFGRPRPWRNSITLDEARAGGGKPESQAVRVHAGTAEVVEAHCHPWREGTPLYRENGSWVHAASGPSIMDAASWMGYDSMHIKATSYIFTPEGIYRINDVGTRWIAPIDYLRR